MLAFNNQELDYITKEFKNVLYSTEESIANFRKEMEEKDVTIIKDIIDDIQKYNSDEKLNKILLDMVYWNLGMWVWFDYECDIEHVYKLLGEEFSHLYEVMKNYYESLEEDEEE